MYFGTIKHIFDNELYVSVSCLWKMTLQNDAFVTLSPYLFGNRKQLHKSRTSLKEPHNISMNKFSLLHPFTTRKFQALFEVTIGTNT